jgi:hypothetical protein
MKKTFTTLSVILFLTNCAVQKTSSVRQTIVSLKYDDEKNITDYSVFPYGQVYIPGKWVKTTYNTVSKQQIFANKDSVPLAISFNPCDKYEFNYNGTKKGFEFLKAFYNWEKEYFVKTVGLQEKLIEVDSIKNYIIFSVKGSSQSEKIDNVYLFAENNCFVSNFSIFETSQWSEEQKVDFLKKMYLQKK